jgi:DNA-binding MarR family transcriptional regulator
MPAPHHHGDEHLRQLLSRKDLASARQRIALGRRLGLAENEVLALAHLARNGELTPSSLGRLLGLSSGGATTLVQRLERGGHVERAENPRDGRSNLLRLTPETVRAAGLALAPFVADLDRLAAALTAEERAVIGGFLQRVAELAEDHAGRLEAAADAEARAAMTVALPGLWG